MVPIGTQGTVLPYIDPTEGPPRFCMDWVGKGRFDAFCKKLKSFYAKNFSSGNKAQRVNGRHVLSHSGTQIDLSFDGSCARQYERYGILRL